MTNCDKHFEPLCRKCDAIMIEINVGSDWVVFCPECHGEEPYWIDTKKIRDISFVDIQPLPELNSSSISDKIERIFEIKKMVKFLNEEEKMLKSVLLEFVRKRHKIVHRRGSLIYKPAHQYDAVKPGTLKAYLEANVDPKLANEICSNCVEKRVIEEGVAAYQKRFIPFVENYDVQEILADICSLNNGKKNNLNIGGDNDIA